MRIVAALGGNALLERGQVPDARTQIANVGLAAAQLAALAEHLAERDGWEAPAWAGDPARTTTWYPDLLEMDRHEATHHGPKAFRRHGVFITHRALGRA